ncbi:unnamed protein product [Adineta steineri]|uniref:Fibronectin type-III domain-containing protein n=1 Tax=Adineta steineri TaxID=433720 RepID=A0A814KMG3_9BILA|nr:unnamed protein product [Adineta steineri]CAF1343876.1 unnamed protein product [Adineta steineri]
MINLLLLLFLFCAVITGLHFNGGTIRWAPINSSINSSVVPISIIQTYSWTYPLISCATDVPISTSGRSSSNANLTCVTDCSTDGGYSTKPVNILTDCQTASSSLGMMTSQRSVNINLTANAHFYLAYVGSAWVSLNDPAKSGLQWSIVCSIDLRMRLDGIINTPPVASVVSPQYAIVNQTTQITIPVSDVNTGDDVRCRWSTYTPGYRRRKRSDEDDYIYENYKPQIYKNPLENKELTHVRKKRLTFDPCFFCSSTCYYGCLCSCAGCAGTACTVKCLSRPACPTGTTTLETPGTIKPTLSYPNRQPIDECGGICYPSSLPNGTSLSGCTISFTGLVPNTWYGVAVQVEDFISNSSNISMSSVPVQFLIYVLPQPTCGLAPIIFPADLCLDVQVGVVTNFDIYAETLCNPNISNIDSIVVTSVIVGMNVSDVITSPVNASISYFTFTWQPQMNQLGSQQLCIVVYTDEQISSQPYCIIFNVVPSVVTCTITTTSTTTTTSETTTTGITTSTSSTTTTTTTTGPAARRRRRRKNEEKLQRDIITQRITPITSLRNHHCIKMLETEQIQNKNFNYTALNNRNSVGRISLSDVPVNSRTSTIIPINSAKRMSLSASSTEQDTPMKVINKNETTPRTSVVSVAGNESIKLTGKKDKLHRMSHDKPKTPSVTRINQVGIIKTPRQKTDTTQSSSIGNTTTINSGNSLYNIQPITNRLASTSLTRDRNRNAGKGVIVTKVTRNSS